MDLKHSTKILLGVLTIWPLVYMVLFIAFILGMVLLADSGSAPPEAAAGFIVIFILHFATILLTIGLTVFYIIHAVKDETLKSDQRIMWILLNVLAGMLAHPIYWYMRIWKQSEPLPTFSQTPPPPLTAGWMDTTDDYTRSNEHDWSERR